MAHLIILVGTEITEYCEHIGFEDLRCDKIGVNKQGLTWSCPWCCADGGRWWGPCSGKTLCGWCSGSGCLSPGRQLPWPHPGLISVTSSTGHGPDTQAASVRHWEKRDMLRKSGTHAEMKTINYRGTSAAQTLGPAGRNTSKLSYSMWRL